ncbi:hypothetical protein LTS15_009620 [Exophiala xenobiotica]|nr:hypothetical protein LTS15_009620 [Exophiala xenobiotica]
MDFFCCRRSRRSREYPWTNQSEATDEWRRLEARIYGIVARTPPENPFDSSPMVVVKAYLHENSVKVVIHSSSVQYANRLRRIVQKSGTLNRSKVKFTVEKPKPLENHGTRKYPKGEVLVGRPPPPKARRRHSGNEEPVLGRTTSVPSFGSQSPSHEDAVHERTTSVPSFGSQPPSHEDAVLEQTTSGTVLRWDQSSRQDLARTVSGTGIGFKPLSTTPESCRNGLPDTPGVFMLLKSFLRDRQPSKTNYDPEGFSAGTLSQATKTRKLDPNWLRRRTKRMIV